MASLTIPLLDIAVLNRGRKKYEGINELAHSLKEFGQLQNIVVRKPTEQELEEGVTQPWVLVAGGRRYAAATAAELPALRAETLEEMPRWRQVAIELEENLQRKAMTWQEEAEMKLRIHELYSGNNPEWQQQDTARILKESAATVSRDIDLAKKMREDKTLHKATSKKAAARQAKIKEIITVRERQSKQIDLSPLRDRIVTADMRDFLQAQPAESVDLLFSDLPWGIDFYERPSDTNISGGGGVSKYDDSRETTLTLIRDVVPELIRVTKRTGWMVLVMNWELHFYLRECIETYCLEHKQYAEPTHREPGWPNGRGEYCSKGADHGGCRFLHCEDIPWIWYRPNSRNNPLHPELHAQNQYELILVCNMGEGKILTNERAGNVLAFDTDYSSRHHAMQKPDDLCEEVIRRLTLPGDSIIDVCFGSGSALRAACRLGRNFRGCDLNPDLRDLAISYVGEVYAGQSFGAGNSRNAPAEAEGLDADDAEDFPVGDEDEWVEPEVA